MGPIIAVLRQAWIDSGMSLSTLLSLADDLARGGWKPVSA